VTVTGANFVNSPNLVCRFGTSVVGIAQWKSFTTLLCRSPVTFAALPEVVSVEVSLNNQDFTSGNIPYTYDGK